MIDQTKTLKNKFDQLGKMSHYLSFVKNEMILNRISDKDIQNLSDQDGVVFAAFRMRFSEFQEHIGKAIRSIAFDQDVEIVGRSDLSAFAEKIGVIDSEDEWNTPRNVRNSINHDYVDDPGDLKELTKKMIDETDTLFLIHKKLLAYFLKTYRVTTCPACGQLDCICDRQKSGFSRLR